MPIKCKLLLIVTLLVIFTSCASEKKQMQGWMGADKQSLIRAMGPPARVASDGGQGQILIYYTSLYNAYNHTTMYRYKMFYADRSGTLYYWRTQGENVPPQQIDVTVYYR